jgi:lysophospholipase L1-like esterase
MVKPYKIIILLALVFVFCGGFMWIIPADGYHLGKLSIQFPTWSEFWDREASTQNVAMQEMFEIYGLKRDSASTEVKMSKEEEAAFREKMRQFQVPEDDFSLFKPFFDALRNKSKTGRVRVLHFGDSQIEGNRITGVIHSRFQSRYGGKGPGWLPVIETIPTSAAKQDQSSNWTRYTVYGKANSEYHKRYGLIGAFSRFTPEMPPPAVLLDDDQESTNQGKEAFTPFKSGTQPEIKKTKAWFEIGPPGRVTKSFTEVRLAFGNFSDTVRYKLEEGPNVLEEGFWAPDKGMLVKSWKFDQTPSPLRFSFEAADSPDFYGISLESPSGVYVDNIAMRGSSGTIFNKMDLSMLKKQLGEDHVAMVILQYGGNSVPYIKSEKQVEDFNKWFRSQIKSLKRVFPDAVFLVIGPSDMSTKVKDKYETFPYLPALRTAMKEAAFSEKAVFWDMFEAMGGRNSMPEWVNAEPALASTDHVHFSPSGSKKIAEWLLEAFDHAERNTSK